MIYTYDIVCKLDVFIRALEKRGFRFHASNTSQDYMKWEYRKGGKTLLVICHYLKRIAVTTVELDYPGTIIKKW